jgi:hypothetical protein
MDSWLSAWREHQKRQSPSDEGLCVKFGSATRTRTWDPMINSHLLYRLSYRGICCVCY